MRIVRERLSYANVTATLALFIALGGSAYAIDKIGSKDIAKNAVKSKHIKKGNVKAQELAEGAVNSAKVLNGSLGAADFATGQLPQGPMGKTGPRGPRGEPGEDATNLFAYGSSTGNLIYGEGATAATRLGIGHYRVTFDRNLTNCVMVPSAATGNPAGAWGVHSITVDMRGLEVDETTVEFVGRNELNDLADSAWMVAVFCP